MIPKIYQNIDVCKKVHASKNFLDILSNKNFLLYRDLKLHKTQNQLDLRRFDRQFDIVEIHDRVKLVNDF